METSKAIDASDDPAATIDEWLLQPNKFDHLEAMRKAAIQSLRTNVLGTSDAELRTALADAESLAMQRQFQRIDASVISTLEKEKAVDEYARHRSERNLDLPADPDALKDPKVAYRYAIARLYRRQFDVTMAHPRKDGCWPLICWDLLDPIDGKRLLITLQFPQAVAGHASTDFVQEMDLPTLRRALTTFEEVRADALRRLGKGGDAQFMTANAGVLAAIAATVGIIVGVIQIAKDAAEFREYLREKERREQIEKAEKEAAERKQRDAIDRWERDLRGTAPIKDGSGHMERYEANRERIGGMC